MSYPFTAKFFDIWNSLGKEEKKEASVWLKTKISEYKLGLFPGLGGSTGHAENSVNVSGNQFMDIEGQAEPNIYNQVNNMNGDVVYKSPKVECDDAKAKPAKNTTPKARKVKTEAVSQSPAKKVKSEACNDVFPNEIRVDPPCLGNDSTSNEFDSNPADLTKDLNSHGLSEDFKDLTVERNHDIKHSECDKSDEFESPKKTSFKQSISSFPQSSEEEDNSAAQSNVNDLLESKTLFHCKTCSYNSAYKGNMIKHIRNKHLGEKPPPKSVVTFSCRFCDATFKYSAVCVKHEKVSHSSKVENE